MSRNLLVTFERFQRNSWFGCNENRTETFTKRYNNIEEAKEVENENKEYGYKILDSKVLTEPEMDKQLIEEETKYNEFIKLHKIGNYQILELKDAEENQIEFLPCIDYESTHSFYYNIDDVLIGLLTDKYLEANEARYAHKFINKILNR